MNPSRPLLLMRGRGRSASEPNGRRRVPEPDGKFSSGIPGRDRVLGGGYPPAARIVFDTDETVGPEDIDLVLVPSYLNFLYQSRGLLAGLPASDSPHAFRARFTRLVTRRRFDSRVRVMDYLGDDEGPQYVVTMNGRPDGPLRSRPSKSARARATAKSLAAEKAARGRGDKPVLQLTAFEVFDTLFGAEKAAKMLYHGMKHCRAQGNLILGLLAPGVGCGAAVRRMADMQLALHRDQVGLIVRGIRPSFPSHVVTGDLALGPPHAALVPRPG